MGFKAWKVEMNVSLSCLQSFPFPPLTHALFSLVSALLSHFTIKIGKQSNFFYFWAKKCTVEGWWTINNEKLKACKK